MGDLLGCGRCGAIWKASGERPDCLDRPQPPIGLDEIRRIVLAQADTIEDGQDVLVALRAEALAHGDQRTADSLRNAPRMTELRRAAVMRAVARLVDRIEGDIEIKKRLRGQGDGETERGRATA